MSMKTDRRVDEYIARFPSETQQRLNTIRAMIGRVFPTAIEDISYKMPTYRLEAKKRGVIHFSAFEKHIGIYAVLTPDNSELYKQIAPYNTGKGTLRFDNDKPLPLDLIEAVITDYAKQIIK